MALACRLFGHKWDKCKCTRCGEILEEEIADLMLYLDQINYSRKHVSQIMSEKDERWRQRIIKLRGQR